MRVRRNRIMAMFLTAAMAVFTILPSAAACAEEVDLETADVLVEEEDGFAAEIVPEETEPAAQEDEVLPEEGEYDVLSQEDVSEDDLWKELILDEGAVSFDIEETAKAAENTQSSERIAYNGNKVGFYQEDGEKAFGMLSPQPGSAFVLDGDEVKIYIVPKNTTVYGWIHWGLISDEELTKDAAMQDNGCVVLSLSKENCGYGIPVAPVKKKDGATTGTQYYLCIPAEEQLAKIADYTAVDEALAKVPEDFSAYLEESTGAVTEAVDAVFRYKSEAQQADVDAMAKAIEDAVAALKEKPADYTAVDAALKKIPTNLKPYTDGSVKAVNDAKAAVVRDLTVSKQADVDTMAKKIESAVAGLKKKPVAAAAGTKLTKSGANYKVLAGSAAVSYTGPSGKKITSAAIPDTITVGGVTYKVTAIEDNAFKNCKKLKSVKIGANITTIGKSAFQNCKVLKAVTIPKNVTTIGANAFAGCKSLRTVTINSSVLKSIGKKAFSKAGSKNYKKLKVKVPKAKLKEYKKMLKKAKLSKKAKVKK